jgi:putative transposase
VEIRKGRHVVDRLHAHLVFVTKRRGKVFGAAHLKRLEEIFWSVCTDFEVTLKEFNGGSDHVHLLVNSPPKVRLSELVNSLKGVSSRRMKQEFPAISTFWSARAKCTCGRRVISWGPWAERQSRFSAST